MTRSNRDRCSSERDSEAGSATVWVLGCCALLALLATTVLLRSLAAVARHEAESAADLASLAGAGQIGTAGLLCSAAARSASANGATLIRCRTQLASDGRSGTVTVQIRRVVGLPLVGAQSITATARAERSAR